MKILNIAIIAHVDHGKTTLVDQMLQKSGTLADDKATGRVMDSNDLEQERGITILSKNTAIQWQDYRINIVDTPGHADFGGEVERILSMVDSVLLLVDAVDGPMPQTRFVTQKAFERGLKPIVVVNKIDREGARPDWVVGQVFDLFDNLGASDEQLDFTTVYTSAISGISGLSMEAIEDDLEPLFKTIVEHVPAPSVEQDGPFQMQISSLDYSSYVGVIGIGRIQRGQAKPQMPIKVIDRDGQVRSGRLLQVLGFLGLERHEVQMAQAGDIVAISGIEGLRISDTVCHPDAVEALPALVVDEPTVSMTFQPNDSPFAGREGKFLTSRQIDERLQKELITNVALRVERGQRAEQFMVSGRGELHLSILLETMRREGYELAVSRPTVVTKEVDGVMQEPYERLTLNVEQSHQGPVMDYLAVAGGEMVDMNMDDSGRVHLEYIVPTRGIIGFHSRFVTITSGTGIMNHTFERYDKIRSTGASLRQQGVLIANAKGKATAYSLWNLEDRGKLLIGPQTEVYEGMIVGIHSRSNDLVVNVIRGKQLTNVRASGSDENIQLTPPIQMTLEQCLDFIDDDELLELTPSTLRLRKKFLLEHERKRESRQS